MRVFSLSDNELICFMNLVTELSKFTKHNTSLL